MDRYNETCSLEVWGACSFQLHVSIAAHPVSQIQRRGKVQYSDFTLPWRKELEVRCIFVDHLDCKLLIVERNVSDFVPWESKTRRHLVVKLVPGTPHPKPQI